MKFIILTICSFLFFPQIDIEKKSQLAVAKYLKNNFENASMYTPGKWGKVEKFMTTYEMTAYYQFSLQMLEEQKSLVEKYKENDLEEAKQINKEAQKKLNKLIEEKKKYKPKQYGWKIYHEYKAPNELGNIMGFGKVFFMDKRFNIVNPDTITVASE